MKFKSHGFFKKALLTSGALLAISHAQSALIEVNSQCSLQDAIASANTDTIVGQCASGIGDDILQINPNLAPYANPLLAVPSVAVPGTQVGMPIINSHITIEGNGVTLRANSLSSSLKVRLFEVNALGTLIIKDMIMNKADDGVGQGSALFNDGGKVSLDNVWIKRTNGAIVSRNGELSINRSVISNNIATDVSTVAGISTLFSLVTIENSSIVNNFYTGLPSHIGIRNSETRGASEALRAAGIHLNESQTVIKNSTISGNRGNYTGGISIENMVNNQNTQGNHNRGGFGNGLVMNHVTISHNAGGFVGGFYSYGGDIDMTFAGNIITGNTSFFEPESRNMSFEMSGNTQLNAQNFIGSNGQSGSDGITLGEYDHVFSGPVEDNLYPLTMSNRQYVHPLKHGSAAIDGLAKSCFGDLFVDQEGKGRGIDGDDDGSFVCDAGAFEHSLPIVLNDGACDLTNAIISANNDASTGGCQPGNGHDILILPENSVHSATSIGGIYNLQNSADFPFGYPILDEALVIEGNGSTIQRSDVAGEEFDLLAVGVDNGLILKDVTITGANGMIGAVTSFLDSDLQVYDSLITQNQSTGLVILEGSNSGLHHSIVSDNRNALILTNFAGGIVTGDVGRLVINQNSFVNNVGGESGGLYVANTFESTVLNNTISNNQGGNYGGVLILGDFVNVQHNTITQNNANIVGGMNMEVSLEGKLFHNIISGNEFNAPNQELQGGPTLLDDLNVLVEPSAGLETGYNVLGQNDNSNSSGFVFDGSDVIVTGNVDTVINPVLSDNGGNILSHLPIESGEAVDMAPAGFYECNFNTKDQRGFIRPWDGNGDGMSSCDAGSIELDSIHQDDLIFKDGFEIGTQI